MTRPPPDVQPVNRGASVLKSAARIVTVLAVLVWTPISLGVGMELMRTPGRMELDHAKVALPLLAVAYGWWWWQWRTRLRCSARREVLGHVLFVVGTFVVSMAPGPLVSGRLSGYTSLGFFGLAAVVFMGARWLVFMPRSVAGTRPPSEVP